MSEVQAVLRATAASRFRAACPDLASAFDLTSVAGLLAAKDAAGGADTRVVAVLNRFDPVRWVRATCGFALGIAPGRAAAWLRSLTTTVFLAGNPANLLARFAFAHVEDDLAWFGPVPVQETKGLCRLLKAFHAPHALPTGRTHRVSVPGDPVGDPRDRVIDVATAGLSLSSTLVHLHHLLAEALLDGHLRPGDRVVVRTVPRVTAPPAHLALRVDVDHAAPHRLRAYAALTAV